MVDRTKSRVVAAPLPSFPELLERKAHPQQSLNDQVDQIFLQLYCDDAEFGKLMTAVENAEAVEGSLQVDDTMLAQRIRNYAEKHELQLAANQQLNSLVRSLRVVMRRYGISRKQRAILENGHDAPAQNEAGPDEGHHN